MMVSCSRHFLLASFLRPPPPREVHIWCIFPDDIQEPSLFQHYESLLSPAEKRLLLNSPNDEIRKERLLTRSFLRFTLARYLNPKIQPSQLKFQKNPYGKPRLVSPSPSSSSSFRNDSNNDLIQFNLSHTKSLIACAVASHTPVGLDVEECDRILKSNNIVSFASRRFCDLESDWIKQADDVEEQKRRFIQMWTLKESYVKAKGTGIAQTPFKRFSISVQCNKSQNQSQLIKQKLMASTRMQLPHDSELLRFKLINEAKDFEKNNFHFFHFMPSPSHFMSLCIDKNHLSKDNECDTKIKMWKSIPYESDECLHEMAISIGCS